MVTLKQAKIRYLAEGTMFCVPLVENAGFGFGYIALARKGWGYLYDVFDHVSDTDVPPEDIESKPLIIQNLLGNEGQFLEARYNPQPWRVMDRKVEEIAPIKNALFQVGSKILDMRDDTVVDDPSIDRSQLPRQSYPLDDEYSYLVTARLLRCDFHLNEEKGEYELIR